MNLIKPMTHIQLAAALKGSGGSVPSDEVLQKLKDVLILLRHGERLDHVDRAWKGCDPPLSTSGRMQALETGLFFSRCQREKAVEQRLKGLLSLIISSPFHRCLETAIIVNIVGFAGSLPLFTNPLLSDWLQAKVFRSAPTLRGSFEYDEADMNIYFRPDICAIKDELLSFFRNVAEDDAVLRKNETTKETAREWLSHLDAWCSTHSRILVWTSPSMCEKLYTAITTSCQKGSTERTTEPPKTPSKGSSGAGQRKQVAEMALKNRACFSQCGISYPELKKDLHQRCQDFMASLFTRDESIDPWDYYIPGTVIFAIRKEQKDCLPTQCKSLDERRKVYGRGAREGTDTPNALLPPLHVLCSTHADIVGGLADVSCPRGRLNKGMSVPYCSMTVLVRHNNFYRMISSAVSGKAGLSKKQNTHRRGHAARCGYGAKEIEHAAVIEECSKVTEPSTDWELVEIGSLKAINTKIVLRYD